MTLEEMIKRWPVCRPRLRIGGFGVWFWDERWRLPYRWYEFHRYESQGFAAMLFGASIMVVRVPSSLPGVPPHAG